MSSQKYSQRKHIHVFLPLSLITLGIVILIFNLGENRQNFWYGSLKLWPLLFIFGGLDGLFRQNRAAVNTFFVAIGLALLLSNFDRISWKVWEIIFTLWPVLIVAAGIDLMFNQKSTWQLTIAGLLVISIMGILAILFDRGITSRPLEENKLTQARGEATIGFLTIRPSFVMLKLVSQGNSELLITGSTKKWNGERIQSSYEIMNETGNYLLESSGMLFLYEPGVKNRAQWNLGVNSRIPVKIAIDQVVGEQDLDLTGLMIDDFGINLILGKSRIQLPSDQTLQGSIKVNFGEVVVNVPVGVGVRVEGKPVIGGVIVPETYEQINGDFESNNYNRAEYKVVLIINQLIGQVTIHQK